MSDTKISLESSASALTGTETLPGVQSGGNVKITSAQLATLAQVGMQPAGSYLTANQSITLSGDVTGSGATAITVSIGANKVARSMLAATSGAALLGATAAGNVADLTGTQATALLDTFTTSLKGLAPASGGGTTNFLRADGSWATPPGSGGPSTVSSQSATSYTAVIGDANTYILFTNASAVTFTIPPNSSVAFAVGTEITMEQNGAGALTIAAGAGVTIHSRGSDLTLAGQYAVAALKKVATDTWTLTGDL